jgi:hypothetical protein
VKLAQLELRRLRTTADEQHSARGHQANCEFPARDFMKHVVPFTECPASEEAGYNNRDARQKSNLTHLA